jgi:hypothetical protein
MNVWCHATCQPYTFLSKRKRVSNTDGIRVVGDKTHSSPQLVLGDMTYSTWLEYLQKNHRYIWYTSPLIPQVTPMHLTLRGQRCIYYENVFMSWGSDHKTSLGPHILGAWLWLVARWTRSPYRTIGTVLKQISSWGDGSGIHITRREDTHLLTLSWVLRYRK